MCVIHDLVLMALIKTFYSRPWTICEQLIINMRQKLLKWYLFAFQRLQALDNGWEELLQMWENRQHLLSQSLNLQVNKCGKIDNICCHKVLIYREIK